MVELNYAKYIMKRKGVNDEKISNFVACNNTSFYGSGMHKKGEEKVGIENIDLSSYPVETDVTLTYFKTIPPTLSTVIENYGETEFSKELEKRTGIKVEYIHPAAGAVAESINLMIASNELCDINLYLLNTVLYCDGLAIDDLIERVGFRTVKVEGKKILLNGEEIYFKGFNRHEDHPTFGCAIPLQLMAHDMQLMLDTGANAVRTCHYPNDERFLDLCDENGVLVWEENHARGLSLEKMQNVNFDKQCADCIDEMVVNHYNHPSIIIWGILNECASDAVEGREKFKKQFEQLRSLDMTRPKSFATCRHFTDICLDLPDILSVNLYPLWYDDSEPIEQLEKEKKWMEDAAGCDKPFLITEYGAGAVYGYRSDTCARWTEERQKEILDDVIGKYMARDDLSGIFLWQFCDCRVTEEHWFKTRPKTINNKGIVDGYRRKKLAYETVKKHYSNNK